MFSCDYGENPRLLNIKAHNRYHASPPKKKKKWYDVNQSILLISSVWCIYLVLDKLSKAVASSNSSRPPLARYVVFWGIQGRDLQSWIDDVHVQSRGLFSNANCQYVWKVFDANAFRVEAKYALCQLSVSFEPLIEYLFSRALFNTGHLSVELTKWIWKNMCIGIDVQQ